MGTLWLVHVAADSGQPWQPRSLTARAAEDCRSFLQASIPPPPLSRRRACAGIGLPAVAASGAITANSLASVDQHLALLDELGV